MTEPTKEKGEIKSKLRIKAHALQFLNGETCTRHANVPITLLNYNPPLSAHPFAQGERFAIWIKFEEAEYREVQVQLNKSLRELTIWFDEENRKKLEEFLEGTHEHQSHF